MGLDCVFCKIIANQIPSTVVHQDEQCIAFEDVNPQAPVHVLVVPRKHLESIADLTAELSGPMVRAIQEVARKSGIFESFRVLTNKGARAGQSVFHLHWHVLGGREFGWPPG